VGWSSGLELRREGEERVLRGAGLRCTERANDAIQQIFPFRYDFGDTFRKGLFPSEYVSERSVQNHRDVRTHVLELAASTPFIRGMDMSRIIRSGLSLDSLSSASIPSPASPQTSNPETSSCRRIPARISELSSTIKIERGMALSLERGWA
jgi:hypothetical protein